MSEPEFMQGGDQQFAQSDTLRAVIARRLDHLGDNDYPLVCGALTVAAYGAEVGEYATGVPEMAQLATVSLECGVATACVIGLYSVFKPLIDSRWHNRNRRQ